MSVRVRVSAILLLVLVMPLLPGVSLAQVPGSVVGRLLAPDNAPVVDATVVLERLPAGRSRVASTDDDGRFWFADLESGDYVLRASIPAFAATARSLRLDGAGAALQVDLRLRLPGMEEHVTVTALKAERDALLVPGEVTVVERDLFDAAQARSLDDVLRYVPGVETGATRRLMSTPNIRGFDDRRVLVLRDGVRVGQFDSAHKGSMFVEANDVESVEVVRGPASALYGSGALGGVIAVTSRDPADLLAAGDRVGVTMSTGYSGAYGEWTFNPRVFGSTSHGLGWTLGYTGRRNDGTIVLGGDQPDLTRSEEDVDAFNARISAPVGRNARFRVSLDALRSGGATLTNLSLSRVDPSLEIDRTTEQYTGTLAFQHSGGRWFNEQLDVSVWLNDLDIGEDRTVDGRLERVGYRTHGIDARNSVRLGGHTLTYGLEAFRDRQESTRDGEPNPFFPDGSQTQVGLYLQDEIQLAGGRLTLVPGVRADRWSSQSADPEIGGSSDRRLNPKLGLVADLGKGVVATAGYSEGFRAPMLNELFSAGLHFAFPLPGNGFLIALFRPNNALAPETSRNVDLGLRYRADRFEARAAYYRSSVDDFIDAVVTASPPQPGGVMFLYFENFNVQDATLWGYEGSVSWLPANSLLLRGGFSLPKGEDASTGERLPSAPPSKLFLGAEWQPLRTATVGLNGRFYGSHGGQVDVFEPQGEYQLFDLYTSWTPGVLGGAMLQVNVDNLTDEAYRMVPFGTPGPGRDVRLGVSWSLGR